MKISSNTTHLWFASLIITEKQKTAYKKVLSKEELIKANKFRFKKDEEAYIAAHAILRIISGKYLNINPEKIKFNYSEFGKPSYALKTNINFNLSHSGEKALLAFINDFEIGADIEFIKRDFDVLDIAANFFSKKEIIALNKITENDKERAFFRCWTRKEAFIKAEGSGLSFPLDKFSVTLDSDTDAKLIETQWDFSERERWSLFSSAPFKDYLIAIATKGSVNNYILKEWQHL